MTGKPDKPIWRKTFDKAERAVGGRLEEMIDTRRFADAMSMTARVQKVVADQVYGTVHRTLHLFGLSSLKDTRAIARQLNRLEAQLRDVSAQLEALEEQPLVTRAAKKKPARAQTASAQPRQPVQEPVKKTAKPDGEGEG